MTEEFRSLVVIAAIAAFVPLIVGLFRIKVAEVVLLLGAGVVFGPEVIGWIQVDDSIQLLSELGLGLLFFLAGMELEQRAIRGQSGRLAAIGWFVSLAVASLAAIVMTATGKIHDTLGVAIALTSTALGTLLPVLRDRGELNTRFGTFFMGAGAWGEFGPIIAISVLLGTKSSFVAILSLVGFAVVALILATLPARLAGDRVRAILERGHHTSSQTALRFTMLLLILLLALAGTFGLDVVLGAFIAGIIVRRFSPPTAESVLQGKIEAIGFGFLIPLFFVVSGREPRHRLDHREPRAHAAVLRLHPGGARPRPVRRLPASDPRPPRAGALLPVRRDRAAHHRRRDEHRGAGRRDARRRTPPPWSAPAP